MTDFTIQNEGTILILIPVSAAADIWIAEHIPDDSMRWGAGVVVEPRYMADIVDGILSDSMTVE